MARNTAALFWLAAALLFSSAGRGHAATAVPVDGGLLFAGLDAAYTFTSPDAEVVQPELAGVIIDGREIGTELVYRVGEAFYLPANLLARMGVQGNARQGRLFLVTPGGEVETDFSYFRDIQGETFFAARMLDEVLKVRWEFSADKYAFTMTLPWWQTEGQPSADLFVDEDDLDVDFNPSTFGLTQIRLDHTLVGDKNYTASHSDLLLRGRLAQGVWRAEVSARQDRDVAAHDYYWLRDFDHMQTLVGNQQVLISPLLPAIETTGAQALYSSKALEFDPYQDQTRSQYIRRFGIPSKEIEGVAQPGAIAELRVNERPIARVRVNLDGTYRFDNVRTSALQFQTLRVHILDQRSFLELDVQDFTRTPIDLLLDEGQTVAFGGAGVQGNPLDPLLGTRGESAFALVRHGLTERLTLEAGLQSAGGAQHGVLGASASFGKRWATSLSLGRHDGSQGYNVDFFGRGNRWQLNVRSQNFGEGFRTGRSPESNFNELRYEYWLTPRISVGAHGRSRQTDGVGDDYLLPGFSWRFSQRNVVRVWPDFDGKYRVDVRTAHRQRDWFEFVHDSSGDRAEYRYFRNPQLEYFGRVNRYSYDGSTTAELGTIWYPNRYDDRSLLAASALAGDGGLGYRFAWETTVLPGLFSHLELRDEPVATEFADRGLQFRWTLSVDLSIAGGRPMPARNDFIQSRAGSIGGRLSLGSGESLQSAGVDQVVILIDGRPHTAVVRGKHFFVRNIPPGVYEVALGSEYLPMSLSPEQVTYRVRVVPAATTSVDFVMNHEFGIFGRVTDIDGQPISGVRIQAMDTDGNMTGSVLSDQYGYYRFSGFTPGNYLLSVPGGRGPFTERRVAVVDAFVFDVNLQLDAAP